MLMKSICLLLLYSPNSYTIARAVWHTAVLCFLICLRGEYDKAKKERESAEKAVSKRLSLRSGVSPAERALRDAVVDRMKASGISIIANSAYGQKIMDFANDNRMSKAMQIAYDEWNENTDETSTANEKDSSRHTEVSSVGGAKVDNRIEISSDYKERLSALSNRIEKGENINPKDFLLAIEDALGSNNKNVDKSQYFKGKEDRTLRLANHRGSATMFFVHDHTTGNTSVVVKMSEKKGKKHPEVELKEFVYFPDKMSSDIQKNIINGLQEWGETGIYNQPCDQINTSEIRNGIREQRVYHGSGADFDHFDHSYMGEGQASQYYGWGTYVTEAKDVGDFYAEDSAKNKFYREANETFSQMPLPPRVLENYETASKSYEDSRSAYQECKARFEQAKESYENGGTIIPAQVIGQHKSSLDFWTSKLEGAEKELEDAQKSNIPHNIHEAENYVTFVQEHIKEERSWLEIATKDPKAEARVKMENAKSTMDEAKAKMNNAKTQMDEAMAKWNEATRQQEKLRKEYIANRLSNLLYPHFKQKVNSFAWPLSS